jgi:hypothetical protein
MRSFPAASCWPIQPATSVSLRVGGLRVRKIAERSVSLVSRLQFEGDRSVAEWRDQGREQRHRVVEDRGAELVPVSVSSEHLLRTWNRTCEGAPSGHDDDDRCTAPSDQPPTQRAGEVVASLGGAPDDEQIGLAGVGDP